ncbi:MAG: caspase family protein [Bacteroidota bacterium]
MYRKALIVGIEDYGGKNNLGSCVEDAHKMEKVLERHGTGKVNFTCTVLTDEFRKVRQEDLRSELIAHFQTECDVALFYFSGHGEVNDLGGFLVTPDGGKHGKGVSMFEVVNLINHSPADHNIIILDCCNSGAMAEFVDQNVSIKRSGISILASSRADEKSIERLGGGLLTSMVVAALEGGAANILGQVTIADVYRFADQLSKLGEPRPVFKSHVDRLIPIRENKPNVEEKILRNLPRYFKEKTDLFQLDPTYEPEEDTSIEAHTMIFGELQSMNRLRLVVQDPPHKHMYHAAIYSGTCSLTPLGQFYWTMVVNGNL